jgi:hypothetical protein
MKNACQVGEQIQDIEKKQTAAESPEPEAKI